jgi:hypothetical protein
LWQSNDEAHRVKQFVAIDDMGKRPQPAPGPQQQQNGRVLHAAYGDTRRDIPMLRLSREAVAVHPDAALRREAEAQGWRLLE